MDEAIAKAHATMRARAVAKAQGMLRTQAGSGGAKAPPKSPAPTSRKSSGSRKAAKSTPRRDSSAKRSSKAVAPVSSVKAPTPLRRRSMSGKSRRVAATIESSPEERAANMAAYHAAIKARGTVSPHTAREAANPGREWRSAAAEESNDDLIDVKPSLDDEDIVSTSSSGSESQGALAPAPRSARRASRGGGSAPARRRASSSRRSRRSRSAQDEVQRSDEDEDDEEDSPQESTSRTGRRASSSRVPPPAPVAEFQGPADSSEEEPEFGSDTESDDGIDAAEAQARAGHGDDEVPRVGRSSSSARRRHGSRVGRGAGVSYGVTGITPQRPSHSKGDARRSSWDSEAQGESAAGAPGAGAADQDGEGDEEAEEAVGPSLVQRLIFAVVVALLALLVAFASVGLQPDMRVAADSAPFVGAAAMFVGMFVSEQEWAATYVGRMPGQ